MLTTDQKGAIAEAAIVKAAVLLSLGVSRPISPQPYDLVLETGHRLLRVQCKWASRHDDIVLVRCRRCRRTRDGLRHDFYTADEVDAFAAYCLELDRCFFLPLERLVSRSTVHLRLNPARNNQRRGVLWADDYAFESLHWAGSGP